MSMTTNEPSVVDASEFTVRRSIWIAAPIDKVWAAVTEADHIARWFPDSAALDRAEVGARGTFTWNDFGTIPFVIEDVEPLRSIAYRWSNSAASESLDADSSTVFRFTLEEKDSGTTLTVVETGFGSLADPAASMESNRGGWNHELDELVAYLEGAQ